MKKYFLLIALFLCFSSSVFASKYIGLGAGPNFGVLNTKTSSLLMDFEWLSHKLVGTRFFMGALHGFWIGTGLSVNVSTDPEYKKAWYATVSCSLPLVINLYDNNKKDVMFGFMIGTTYAFSLSSQRKHYMFIKPFEAYLVPATWYVSPGGSNFSNALRIYFSSQIGIRMNI